MVRRHRNKARGAIKVTPSTVARETAIGTDGSSWGQRISVMTVILAAIAAAQ